VVTEDNASRAAYAFGWRRSSLWVKDLRWRRDAPQFRAHRLLSDQTQRDGPEWTRALSTARPRPTARVRELDHRVMTCHPAELSLDAIMKMDRDRVIHALHEFGKLCSFHFAPEALGGLDVSELRKLLKDVRRHYQSKGY
jgi:hypothetical protein